MSIRAKVILAVVAILVAWIVFQAIKALIYSLIPITLLVLIAYVWIKYGNTAKSHH